MYSFIVAANMVQKIPDNRWMLAKWNLILSDEVPDGVAWVLPKIDGRKVNWCKSLFDEAEDAFFAEIGLKVPEWWRN